MEPTKNNRESITAKHYLANTHALFVSSVFRIKERMLIRGYLKHLA